MAKPLCAWEHNIICFDRIQPNLFKRPLAQRRNCRIFIGAILADFANYNIQDYNIFGKFV